MGPGRADAGERAVSYLRVDSLRPRPGQRGTCRPGPGPVILNTRPGPDRRRRVAVTGTAVGGGRPAPAGPGTVQPVVQLPPAAAAQHQAAVAALRASYAALPPGA